MYDKTCNKENDEELLNLCKTVCFYKLHPQALKNKDDTSAMEKVYNKLHELVKCSIPDIDETDLSVITDQILNTLAIDCSSGVENFRNIAEHILDEYKIFS